METMVSMFQEDAVAPTTASPPACPPPHQKNTPLVPATASLWGLGGCRMGDTLGWVRADGAEVCQKLEKPWQVPRSPNWP